MHLRFGVRHREWLSDISMLAVITINHYRVLRRAQRLHCGLPSFGIVFCLWQFSDVMCGVAERGSSQCARFEIILGRLEGWQQEQVTWFLAIPYPPKLMR